MLFRISDTFTASLTRLTGDEQKAVKTTAFDLQMNPANPGMQFHKLDKAKDKCFWSVRVSGDLRLIVHRTEEGLLLCYVDHHDNAYRWAERRRIDRHPRTGAAQLVEIRETVRETIREIEVPRYVDTTTTATAPVAEVPVAHPPTSASHAPLFADRSDEELLGYGVPTEWLAEVKAATEATIFGIAERLPAEAGEALLELATGGSPSVPVTSSDAADPFAHPDAQRRFRVMANADELQRALDFPWDKWTVFLHPSQRELVERNFSGPARVAGSAGTGKTVVALHRAVHLARIHPAARVLLTTFSITLARSLRLKIERLVGNEPAIASRIAVRAIDEVGIELYRTEHGEPKVPTSAMLRSLLRESQQARQTAQPAQPGQSPDGSKFTLPFLESEWSDVVDAWQITTWEEYRTVPRLGRKTRLGEKQRQALWEIFSRVRAQLDERGLVTMPALFAAATTIVRSRTSASVGSAPSDFAAFDFASFDFAVIDEAQDVSVPQLRFLSAMGERGGDALFFAGDLGQRIFQTPFSWKSLGVDIRGRSQSLRINYRTSHQIRQHADRLLPSDLADVDGVSESRRSTISIFNGPDPTLIAAASPEREAAEVGSWLTTCTGDGMAPHEIGVFVRSPAQLARAREAVRSAGLAAVELDGREDHRPGHVAISTMHLAKGLEFRAVAVMACDDEVIPLQERMESATDESDLEETYNTERHLLYVACTRARDRLLVSGVEPLSEFVDDLRE